MVWASEGFCFREKAPKPFWCNSCREVPWLSRGQMAMTSSRMPLKIVFWTGDPSCANEGVECLSQAEDRKRTNTNSRNAGVRCFNGGTSHDCLRAIVESRLDKALAIYSRRQAFSDILPTCHALTGLC